ncbi:MAG TPA: hypothetical protein VGS62_03310 [Streptosporangiaceae bacterium]|nr:hypothetical protein [Streptosporangiaceae bacterium]
MRPGARRFRRSAGPAEPAGASQPEQAPEARDAPGRPGGPRGGNGQAAGRPDVAAAETGTGQPDTAAVETGAGQPDTVAVETGTGRSEAKEAEAGEAVSPEASWRRLIAPVTRRAAKIAGLALAPVRRAGAVLVRPRSDASGRAFARLTVLPAVLVIAWLVPGVPLLLGRAFSLAPMLLISIPLAAAIIVIGLRRVPARWPLGAQAVAARDAGRAPWWALTGTIVIAAGFASWQLRLNSQQLIVNRDQGIYLQFGYWIAQHGAASVPVSLDAFGGPHAGLIFGSLGFIQHGVTLVPQFLAGLPIVLAAGVWSNGVHGALLVPPLLGGLAVLAFGGLVGRLAGARWAPAGALVLALALPEQYTSRSTFSEPLVQILLFGGLCLIIDSLCSPTRRTAAEVRAAETSPPDLDSTDPHLGSIEAGPGSFEDNPGSVEGDPGSVEGDPGPVAGDPGSVEVDPRSSFGPHPHYHDRFGARAGGPEPAPGEANAFRFGDEAAGGEALAGQTSPLGPLDPPDPLDPYEVLPGALAEQTAPLALGLGLEPAVAARKSGWAARWRRLFGLSPGRRARVRRKTWAGPGQARWLAALGGLALGLAAVVRVDALNALLPVIPLIGILFAARKPQWLPLSLGLLAGVGYGLANGYVLTRPYLDSLALWMRAFGIIAAAVALVTLCAALIMRIRAPRRLVRRVLAAPPLRWLPGAAATLIILVMIAFAARPYVQTVRGDTNKSMISYVGYLQRLAGLPLDPRRLYAEDTLYWVIWYIGVPAVLLATFGMAILARRVTRSLVTWQDSGGGARVWGLALLITVWVTVTVLWRPAVAPDQPWASRRLVTVVLPGLILVAVWTAAWLTSQARQRGAGRVASSAVAAFCVAALLLPTALTTFGVGVAASGSPLATPSSAGLAFEWTSAGETGAIDRLCAAIGPGASVVILDQRTADRFAQLIRGICDTPTGLMIHASPFNVQNVIAGILRIHRHPVLLGGFRAELESYGATPSEVLNLTTTQDAHELAKPPRTTWRIRYVVWMVKPG